MNVKRETNYDLLRVAAMIAVIMTHVSGTWLNGLWGFAVAGMSTSEMMHPFMAPLYYGISRFAVPCFVMLSGAFVMSNTANREYVYFYKKSFQKIGIPTLFFSGGYIVYGMLSCIWGDNAGAAGIRSFVEQVISGAPHYHMWYLYTLAGVYALAPAAIRIKESISRPVYKKVVIGFLILSSISGWTSSQMMNWDVGKVFEYLAYFMIGDVIRENVHRKNHLKGCLFVVLGILVEAGMAVWFYVVNYQTVSDMYEIQVNMFEYMGIPIAAASVLIFFGFSLMNITERKWITKLSATSLYVYLFHAFIYDLIRKGFYLVTHMHVFMQYRLDGLFAIPLLTAAVLLITYPIARVWMRIARWYRLKKNLL